MFPIITTMDELLIYTGRIDYTSNSAGANLPLPGKTPGEQEDAEDTK